MKQKVPNQNVPIANEKGRVNDAWTKFFQSLVSAPSVAEAVTVGFSPFDYTAIESGALVVRSGTVSAISLIRGPDTIPLGLTSGLIPVGAGDIVRITYTVAPTVTFLPG